MARPDLGKKWNYVVDVFFDTCDAPFTAYFKAAYPALLRASLSYYCLDPVQIFTGYVRPGGPLKGTRGSGHGRGSNGQGKSKGFWGKFKKVYGFDPNDWVSKNLPFNEDMNGRKVPGGAEWGWQGYNQFERFQNFMFMYMLVEDIFYETALGIAKTDYCENQRAAVFQGYSASQGNFGLLDRTPCVINEELKNRYCHFAGGNGVGAPWGPATASISCGRIERWDGNPDTSQCKLHILRPGDTEVTQAFPDGGKDAAAYGRIVNSGFVSFEMSGPSYTAYDVQFSVFAKEKVPKRQSRDWCSNLADEALNWAKLGD